MHGALKRILAADGLLDRLTIQECDATADTAIIEELRSAQAELADAITLLKARLAR